MGDSLAANTMESKVPSWVGGWEVGLVGSGGWIEWVGWMGGLDGWVGWVG